MGACEAKLHLGETELTIETSPQKVALLLARGYLYDKPTRKRIEEVAKTQFLVEHIPHIEPLPDELAQPKLVRQTNAIYADEKLSTD